MMYKKINIKLVSFFLILLFLFGCVVGCDNSKNSESEYSQNEDCQHEHTKWVTITDATFDNEGLKQLQCTKCKEVLKEEVIEELYLTQEEIKKKLNSSVIKYCNASPPLGSPIVQSSIFNSILSSSNFTVAKLLDSPL